MYASKYGRGHTLRSAVSCDKYTAKNGVEIPYIESSVILNENKKEIVVFAVNRSLEDIMELELDLQDFGEASMVEHIELYSDDLKAINTKELQNVTPKNKEVTDVASMSHRILLNKHSWNMIRFTS